MLNLVDVHAHLSDDLILNNLNEYRKEYLNNNVKIVIDSGCELKIVKQCHKNAEAFSEVYFTAGLHPQNAKMIEDIEEIAKFSNHKKCVAMGEIGLDYHYEPFDKELQKQAFIKQLELANFYNVPVVIHSRDACLDTVTILQQNKHLLKNGFLMHCYSESLETAKILLKLGAYFSFGGSLTFKNSKRIEVLKNLPLDRVLIETDCPFLTPVPFRGQINSPKNVSIIYDFICDNLGFDKTVFASAVYNNALNLFTKIKDNV